MSKKPKESPLDPLQAKLRLQCEEGERRRQEYLATLDPWQREELDPPGPE
jgi:hypothetical protein